MKCADNIESLLRSVLRWLENVDEDEKWWQLQTKVVQLCLLELDQTLTAEGGTPARRLVEHVRDMADAMLQRNRTAALESGKLALALLSDSE
jgi:hypothetical protein